MKTSSFTACTESEYSLILRLMEGNIKKKDVVKILLVTDLSSGYGRGLLNGLVSYAQSQKGWAFYRMPLYYRMMHGDKEIIRWAKKWDVDAIVAQMNDIDVKMLSEMNIPIIVQNYKDRIPGVCNLTGDYIGTGRMAANHFLNLGYRSFAYYGIHESVWSRERLEGYRSRLAETGLTVDTYLEPSGSESWNQDFDAIGRWLLSLPENTAVFCCDDYYALHVTETCKIFDIAVPDTLAILGVDNDEMLCNISNPPLSSIVIDARNGGYEAGAVIGKLIDGEITEPVNIRVPPLRVVSRGSTEKYASKDRYVQKVIEYVWRNFGSLSGVEELLELVPLSRRMFEKRFKKETGTTIYQFLQNYRIDRFAEMLVSSDLPVEDIAISCGFADGKNVSRVFHARKGMTPSEFRRKKSSSF